MKIIFKKENLLKTISTFVFLVLGVLFCVIPVNMYNFVESVLCAVLLLVGIVLILIHSLMSGEDKNFKLILYGIIGLALGLCMLLVPRVFGIILSVLIGFSGVSLILTAQKQKKETGKGWITDFVIGVIVSVLSLATIVLSGTNVAKTIIAIFAGVICLINGVYLLIGLIKLIKSERKQLKEKEKSQSVETENVEEIKITENSKDAKETENKDLKK